MVECFFRCLGCCYIYILLMSSSSFASKCITVNNYLINSFIMIVLICNNTFC